MRAASDFLGRATFLAALVVVVVIGHDVAARRTGLPPVVRVVHNGILSSPQAETLRFRFEPIDTPALGRLSAREHLDRLSTPDRQFDRILRVKNWVASQWAHGVPDPAPPWDAMVVLDWIRAGKTGGACGQYAQVLLQSLAALGMRARYVEIGSLENPYAHYVTEVWSNDFDKWVLMDPDYNVHFERAGIPINALELHDALLDDTLASVHPVLGAFRDGHPAPDMWPKKTAEFYRYLRYHMKADHLARPNEPPFDRFNDMIGFEDPRVQPWERSTVESPFPKERLTRQRTNDRDALYPRLNQVKVDLVNHTPDGSVAFTLRHNLLQFDRYEFRIIDPDGDATPWQSVHAPIVTWPSPDVGSTLEVRAVNIRDVAGPTTRISADDFDTIIEARLNEDTSAGDGV